MLNPYPPRRAGRHTYVVIDLETQKEFAEVEGRKPELLLVSGAENFEISFNCEVKC